MLVVRHAIKNWQNVCFTFHYECSLLASGLLTSGSG